MDRILPLMQREWLQHRFGWALMAGIPLLLAAALVAFGQVELGADLVEKAGPNLPLMMAAVSIVGGTAVIFLVVCFSAWIIVAGLARRDHADRSVEFWMSLPVSHTQSLAVPLLVHLLLVPAAALLVGWVVGHLISLLMVGRMAGLGAWFALPWGAMLTATGAVLLRLLAGLPMALLWWSPLILLVVLMTAWFKRWAWVILGVGVGLGSVLLERLFGQPLLAQTLLGYLRQGGHALVNGGQGGFVVGPGLREGADSLALAPSWAWTDFTLSLGDLASPMLLGGLLFAAGCFALLVHWRQRGAAASA
jgi:hypothetical protein